MYNGLLKPVSENCFLVFKIKTSKNYFSDRYKKNELFKNSLYVNTNQIILFFNEIIQNKIIKKFKPFIVKLYKKQFFEIKINAFV